MPELPDKLPAEQPQSTPVSSPLRFPSSREGSAQVPERQMPVRQSEERVQVPDAHFAPQLPPHAVAGPLTIQCIEGEIEVRRGKDRLLIHPVAPVGEVGALASQPALGVVGPARHLRPRAGAARAPRR